MYTSHLIVFFHQLEETQIHFIKFWIETKMERQHIKILKIYVFVIQLIKHQLILDLHLILDKVEYNNLLLQKRLSHHHNLEDHNIDSYYKIIQSPLSECLNQSNIKTLIQYIIECSYIYIQYLMQESQQNYSETAQSRPRLYGWRWIVVVFFILSVFMNSIPGEIYVPAADDTINIYHTTETMVTMASTSYVIMHPILSIPCSQFIVKYGWAKATNIGVIFTIGGSLIKLLVNQTGFYVIVIGQFLIGAGKPFILNSQATMAQNWFYPDSRARIIIILNVLNLISNVVTLMIPGKWIFKGYDCDPHDPQSVEKGKELMQKLNLVQLALVSTLIPCFLLLRNQPPTPPSQLVKKEEKSQDTKRTLIRILTNRNFQCCLVAYSVYLGLVKAIVLILPYMFKSAGQGKGEVSIAGSIANVAAAISQSTLAACVTQYKNHKKKLVQLLMIISTGALILFYFCLVSENIVLIYISITLLGFFIMPISPVLMDLSCDTVFPISPSFAIGIMYIGSQLLLVVFTQVEAVMVGGADSTKERVGITMLMDVVLQAIGLFLFSFIKIRNMSAVNTEVQESFQQGRSLMEKGQAFPSSYKGSSFFNVASNIAFIGITPTTPYSEYAAEKDKMSSEIVALQN